MNVCYNNTYGTLKQILLFYLNYIVIKIGVSCSFLFFVIFFLVCFKGRNKLN